MCCLITVLALIGPRAAIVVWWLLTPARWAVAFHNFLLWPVLGFFFLPWTTLMWVLIAPTGQVMGIGWLFLALAFVVDIAEWSGGAFGNRGRMSRRAPVA